MKKVERIDLKDFLEPFMQNKFFIEEEIRSDYENSEWPNNFISIEILDEDCFNQFSGCDENFPYELIDVKTENNDGYQETTTTGTFKRLSDGKKFTLLMHDGGFIGPDTLSTYGYLEEVF